MSSSNRPRRRGALHAGVREDTAAWEPVELDGEPSFGEGGFGAEEGSVAVRTRAAGAAGTPEPDAEESGAGPDLEELQLQIDEAYQRGVEEGRAEGAAAEALKLRGALEALERAAAAFDEMRPQWLGALEQNLIALSTAVAREILGRELKGQPDDIAALVHQAISEFPLDAPIRVRLNPADLTTISAPGRGDALRAGRELRWVPDAGIAAGGCLVEGPESLVDGRIEKALERIYSRLVYDD